MKKAVSRFEKARRLLIFWTLFVGIGAVAGASGMLLDPTGKSIGMDAMLPFFQILPFAEAVFQDFTFSGWALLIVNGLTNLTAAVLLVRKKTLGVGLGGLFGVTLMLWICIQFYMFPLNFMSTAYFIFGLLQAATGYAARVFFLQERFQKTFSPKDYPRIGTDPHKLVVYFSRMGYVKKAAYEAAEASGAKVLELRSTEKTEGTLGFWWCGRFAMHRWDMPIAPIEEDLSSYSHVTLCSPIWAFSLAAPMRTFCRTYGKEIQEADYILLHHTRGTYKTAAKEMDALLHLHGTRLTSVCCQKGKVKEKLVLEEKDF